MQEQINDLKSGYEAYRDRPSTSAPDLKPEDYARHVCIGVDPATEDGRDESVILACVFNEHGQAVAMGILRYA